MTWLEQEADKLWSEVVRKMAGCRCAICRSTRGVQAHHLVKRRHKQFRHDINNGLALCIYHHEMAETHQKAFLDLLKETLPLIWDWQEKANRHAVKPFPTITAQDYSERCANLRLKLKALK